MIQLKTQTQTYWERDFTLNEQDIEQIYNHFLEVERPQTTSQIIESIIAGQVLQEKNALQRRLQDRLVYQPQDSYAVGDGLVFPGMEFAHGEVVAARAGINPDEDAFTVIAVQLGKKQRYFASGLKKEHVLNTTQEKLQAFIDHIDSAETARTFLHIIEPKVVAALLAHEEFILLGGYWFIKPLLADVNVGHLNLAEAVLDFEAGGGPMATPDILKGIGLDPGIDLLTQAFSLNYALINDARFDEVAPRGQVAWFLRRMQDPAVTETPIYLRYEPVDYDRIMLSSHMLLLERELADEWSDLPPAAVPGSVTLSLIYPHRASGTLPLNSTIRSMLPLGRSPRQIMKFVDTDTGDEIDAWIVQDGRYIYGFKAWFEEAGIPIGGYVTIAKTETSGVLHISCDRRRPKREDVRLASIEENAMRFELSRRSIACDYDDLMVIGTEFTSAVDAFSRRVNTQGRSLTSLLAMLMPELADLTPQQAVHAKTIYSAVNMLRRMPPGPIFAELLRHPAFQSVGDQYWMFERRRWQRE